MKRCFLKYEKVFFKYEKVFFKIKISRFYTDFSTP